MKTVAEMLARLKELLGELTVLKDKKDVPEAERAAHLKSMSDKLDEIEALEKDIELAKRVEAAAARSAAPANDPVDPAVAATPKKDLKASEKIGIIMAGMVTALNEEGTRGFRPTMRAIEENGYGALAKEFEPAQKRTLNSANASAGGILLPETMSPDIIDLLRPNTTFLQGNPVVIPMPNGTYKQPAAASGATAAYRGETAPKSVSQPTFKAINMSAKLLGAIVPLSNQLIRWSGPDIDSWARMDLSNAMGVKMDYMAYFGEGLEDTPLGLLNIPGVGSYAATNSTAPTYTQVDADARKLRTPIESYAGLALRPEWRMAPRVFDYLADMRDGNGNLIYPSLSRDNPTWKGGYPVRKTTQFPINLGSGADESYIALIAFGNTYFGDALRMQLAVSDVATVVNGSQTINAFQDGVTLIRAEAEHDFDTRYVEAVQVLTGVRWGG